METQQELFEITPERPEPLCVGICGHDACTDAEKLGCTEYKQYTHSVKIV
jgi:hypothetical protein